jgi:hypothetical protein
LIIKGVVVSEDEAVQADEAACCDDTHDNDAHNDAYNNARYDRHVHDMVPVDAVRRAVMGDGVVRADVVAPVRMHTFLITGINMRIFAFS